MTASSSRTLSLEEALQEAVAHHRAGRLGEAEELYRAILEVQPEQPDANHNLGVVALQTGIRRWDCRTSRRRWTQIPAMANTG